MKTTMICDECGQEVPFVLDTGHEPAVCFDCAELIGKDAFSTVLDLVRRFIHVIAQQVAVYQSDHHDWILVDFDVEETDDFDLLSAVLGNLNSKADDHTTVSLAPGSVAFMDVESSNLESVAFRAPSNTLYIRFQGNDGTYLYADFDEEEWSAFDAADSWGEHFHAHIQGKHEYVHVD